MFEPTRYAPRRTFMDGSDCHNQNMATHAIVLNSNDFIQMLQDGYEIETEECGQNDFFELFTSFLDQSFGKLQGFSARERHLYHKAMQSLQLFLK